MVDKMAPRMAAVSRALPSTLLFFCTILLFISSFKLCNLLKRALSYNMIEKNFYKLGQWWKKLPPAYNRESPWRSLPVVEPEQRRRQRKRGSRAGVLVRLRKRENRPPLPSILLANVQSLDNKLDELRSRMAFQRDIKNCNVLVFTETWLDPSIPDSAIVPEGLSIHRQDRTINSGKSKGGGVCFMVNNKWCSDVEIISTGCSPDLEHLMIRCRPYYLPCEFTSVVMTAVYVPPHADTNKAMDELFGVIDRTETSRPEAAFIVAGDFNSANLRKVLLRYHQHISCPTRGENTLDHVYTPYADTYKALPSLSIRKI
ncbi:hypothetical protein L3Q82_001923 [Scortum barcoo]|uniref:Uncharacterized protein n=1 Tax=Scortum barcoo TaxID=214431 RepID=A0ACB8W5F7_9TELE|nr:hypothetical protein L3Q82_001923 [Scortum barcoo]